VETEFKCVKLQNNEKRLKKGVDKRENM